jgi:hypothetical protein
MTPESRNSGATGDYIVRQQFGKQFPAEMNTLITTEQRPFLCNGEVNTPISQNLLRTVFSFGADPRLYNEGLKGLDAKTNRLAVYRQS